MPHIHTKPGQHDMTVRAYIVRKTGGKWECLVHMHKKLGVLMQAGGHIELNETPWRAIIHELEEETGYTPQDLQVLQPVKTVLQIPGGIVHPTPLLVNTHTAGPGPHYHSDICYAFVAKIHPSQKPADSESQDLRWMSLEEMMKVPDDKILRDVVKIYTMIIEDAVNAYHVFPAEQFSLDEPKDTYGFSVKANSLKVLRFGDPALRKKARRLSNEQIISGEIRSLVAAMQSTLATNQYGVGLAAPQVGKSVALSVIGIKPTPTRPNVKKFDAVIINPLYTGVGEKAEQWEGCISCGTGDDTLYAKVPRYTKIRASWFDEHAKKHEEVLDGFVAHVFQHETNHLDGVLFVDRVTDMSTYMMRDEYRKRIVEKQ